MTSSWGSTLFQTIACRLLCNNPLLGMILTYYKFQLSTGAHLNGILSSYQNFALWKQAFLYIHIEIIDKNQIRNADCNMVAMFFPAPHVLNQGPGVGITKAPYVNFSINNIFRSCKSTCHILRVTFIFSRYHHRWAAVLHLSNINVLFNN